MSRQIFIDKFRKCGTEEFWGRAEDDPTKVEYWLENIQRTKLTTSGRRCQQWYQRITLTRTSSSLNFKRQRKFVYLSKYTREIVPNKEEMCICFEDGLNDEIKTMIGGTKIR
ncbi:Hexaprenyldihydroxybenzoate methyltransferase, mitochondrial-like protein [Gossypium australe]|uniref:Hexaprenyldihydroxybenzoate methyltransferase, mitochondrial-like protein n=1 Tax=Gossypium australe TaxID=47621 RepID=A0A5B6X0Y6_9ROSI|nr:Hexaprenyldihydroxybenzoate methyltransferase, mitochondrial-like protein [Gossypium australe]